MTRSTIERQFACALGRFFRKFEASHKVLSSGANMSTPVQESALAAQESSVATQESSVAAQESKTGKRRPAKSFDPDALRECLTKHCSAAIAKAAQHFSSQELEDIYWAAAMAIETAINADFELCQPGRVKGCERHQILFELARQTASDPSPERAHLLLQVFSVSLKTKVQPDFTLKAEEATNGINTCIDAIQEAEAMNSQLDTDLEDDM